MLFDHLLPRDPAKTHCNQITFETMPAEKGLKHKKLLALNSSQMMGRAIGYSRFVLQIKRAASNILSNIHRMY
jgi:hypothetical protein